MPANAAGWLLHQCHSAWEYYRKLGWYCIARLNDCAHWGSGQQAYAFFPQTWVLPLAEAALLEAAFQLVLALMLL